MCGAEWSAARTASYHDINDLGVIQNAEAGSVNRDLTFVLGCCPRLLLLVGSMVGSGHSAKLVRAPRLVGSEH